MTKEKIESCITTINDLREYYQNTAIIVDPNDLTNCEDVIELLKSLDSVEKREGE